MKENKELEIKVKRSGAAFAASIYCNMCMKSIALGTKSGKPLISNWSRHVAKCIKSPKDKTTIQTFFPTASTSTYGETIPMFSDESSSSSAAGLSTDFQLAEFSDQSASRKTSNSFRLSPPK